MDAIEEAVHDGSFHEIILSTLPHHLSHWLHVDLHTASATSASPSPPSSQNQKRDSESPHPPARLSHSPIGRWRCSRAQTLARVTFVQAATMCLTMAVYGDAPYTNATAVISSPKLSSTEPLSASDRIHRSASARCRTMSRTGCTSTSAAARPAGLSAGDGDRSTVAEASGFVQVAVRCPGLRCRMSHNRHRLSSSGSALATDAAPLPSHER